MSLNHSDFFGYYGMATAYPTMYNAYATETGSTWYQANSTYYTLSNTRCDGQSNRWAKVVGGSWNDLGYEVVCYFKPSGGFMTSGGHIGLKHGGPYHTPPCDYTRDGKCCCWWDGGIRENGDTYLEIEYPHPNNQRKSSFTNIGRHIDNGSMLGVRWSLRKLDGYHRRRLRMWVDTSGGRNYKWRKMYDYTDENGRKMPSHYAIVANQQLQIRISDIPCSKINMNYVQCRKMV